MKPVNLLPKQYRSAQASGARSGSAYVVVGALGLLLALVLPWTLIGNNIKSGETEVASVKGEISTLEQKVAGQSSFAAFRQVKETRLASVTTLAGGRFDWERVMRELALLLPRKAWLLDATATTAPVDTAATPGAGAAVTGGALDPKIKLIGCAVRQRDVADMIVRLRRVHRATDVKLAESAQQVSVGGASADGAPSGDACPSRRFQFDVTVSFDPVPPVAAAGSKVPASLGGGS